MADVVQASKVPQTKYLKDYRKPDFTIDTVDLIFDLRDEVTHVTSRLVVRRQGKAMAPLVLDGSHLTLVSIALDGENLTEDRYRVDEDHLTISDVPDEFELTIQNDIDPANNTALEGLYISKGMYCTQCEAEGFRRITYFLDRPDVMATYRVRIEADQKRYPVLLSNGNEIERGKLGGGRHFAVWEDPFPKPSYLFALVAGDLVHLEDHYRTVSGKDVTLRLFVAPQDLDKCRHAMDSLKRAMKWDEEVYGLEYDLNVFNIVAVSHFNMGAMENKSLNIFNTKCVLANPETATDSDFAAVESVVAHEYFHNWTGNRVTCRDWFQLSLKEGLTVFRDQEFSADMGSRAVKRIEDVRMLRQHQFAEDAGPMAHPVRPDNYMEINNFYTVTVYEKGAEVIRMYHTLLGPENYRKGIDLYFERHDGEAVTCDDFLAAMQDASGRDLGQFSLWYSQAGTPEVTVTSRYDAEAKTFELTLSQFIPDTPGQTGKKPMHIPVAVGLVGPDGTDLPLRLEGENAPVAGTGTRVLELKEASQTFRFVDVPERPVPSVLRGFSAPVRLKTDLSEEEYLFLLAHDNDPFNRWEAAQTVASNQILKLAEDLREKRSLTLERKIVNAFGKVLDNDALDNSFKAEIMTLPSEGMLSQLRTPVDVDGLHVAREFMRGQLAHALEDELMTLYRRGEDHGPYEFSPEAVGRRRLKNTALGYLMELGEDEVAKMAVKQFMNADNMTDEIAALSMLTNSDCAAREGALQHFYDKWKHEPLVLDKWFAVQAACRRRDTLDVVRKLTKHPDFDLKTPNRVRALVSAFCAQNPVNFHDRSGRGYEFLADILEQLDPINPQISAGLVRPLTRWKVYDAERQDLMRQTLERILSFKDLSPDVYEIVSKSLR
ncbi:aminopeptidase N [Luteithermobacter gelatinilyticus]|uniref:aminopeptidase N n=1 Tax=Luteithermobacter gelatinilyticus TaxID=2582913 RepID=UPI0011061ADB|nr:aminopeptidase N [Luteithermobacter gelatinilyticus]